MSTRESGANLVQALKDLSLRWQETKTHWRDIKAQQFERDRPGLGNERRDRDSETDGRPNFDGLADPAVNARH